MCSYLQEEIELTSSSPFNLDFIPAGYLFPPWNYQEGVASRGMLTPSGMPVAVRIRQSEFPKSSILKAEILSQDPLLYSDTFYIKEKIDWSLGLSEDFTDFFKLAKKRSELAKVFTELKGYRVKATNDFHEMLIAGILSQNISFLGFRQMLKILVENFGSALRIGAKVVHAFPTIERLASAKESKLEAIGLNYRAKFVKGVAKSFLEGLMEKIEGKTSEEIVEELLKLRGVGSYTAHTSLIYGLRRYDLIFYDTFVGKVFGRRFFRAQKVDEKSLRKFASERWGKLQGLAMDFLLAQEIGRRNLGPTIE